MLRRALSPRFLGYHLLALVLVALAAGLGVWQYDAWQSRREAEAADLTQARPIPLSDAIGPDDPFPGDRIGQPVTVSGTWVPSGTIYVSGREHEGQDGYWVVTPLAVGVGGAVDAGGGADPGARPALEIVRGWTGSLADVPPPPRGHASLTAWLQPAEGTGESDPDPGDDVLPQLRIADAIQHVDQDLYGAYAVATSTGERTNDGTTGLEPADLEQLPESGRFTALRNLLYAFEWWFFGLFAGFIWWRWVREDVLGEDEASGM